MNIYESLLAKAINGGGGENPNRTETIIGTLAGVLPNWTESEWRDLTLAMQSHNASVVVVIDTSAIGGGEFGGDIRSINVSTAFYNNVDIRVGGDSPQITGAESAQFAWGDGKVIGANAVVYYEGAWTILPNEYGSLVPTTTTIYWHPMP